VLDRREQPDVTVIDGEDPGSIGAPHHIGRLGDERPGPRTWQSARPRSGGVGSPTCRLLRPADPLSPRNVGRRRCRSLAQATRRRTLYPCREMSGCGATVDLGTPLSKADLVCPAPSTPGRNWHTRAERRWNRFNFHSAMLRVPWSRPNPHRRPSTNSRSLSPVSSLPSGIASRCRVPSSCAVFTAHARAHRTKFRFPAKTTPAKTTWSGKLDTKP
jgi:hypothetical protein